MVKSISIRNVQKFEIPDGKTAISEANVPLGSIVKTGKTLTTEDKIQFEVFNCVFSKDISEEISAYIPQIEEYVSLVTYRKNYTFNMYYSATKNILFSEGVTSVTKGFLKALQDTEDITIKYSTPHFDFDSISNLFAQTKGVRFNSNDQGVNNKMFNGNAVNENVEASEAIQNDDATQIIGVMDIGGKGYTVSFTQSGTLIVFNKLFIDKEVPMLELATAALDKIGMLSK
ncbi:hypothetical protein SN811_04820 [Ligilactobacillus agilis]|uniref:Uncharacterized protein n=1 Tax=Ligilactobacillus agilis TaxID=1601 RepID=A0A6F9Y3B8_9LACO|nr:hypothetical protein [Ligilactobacillus agilis]GET11982.1 hypothetical protein SN811_04820 [Ligilactobacillus agilis]